MRMIYKTLFILLLPICSINTSEINPIIIYFNSLYAVYNDLYMDNMDDIEGKKLTFFNHQVEKKTIKFLMDFIFYYNSNKKININSLWPDMIEQNHQDIINSINDDHPLLKNKKFFTMYGTMYKAIINGSIPDNIYESLISDYYFSIYTQKFLIIKFFQNFLNKENPDQLYGFFNSFHYNYPENPYIIWMKILVIINYYEHLSPLLYQSNFYYLNKIFYLIKDVKNYYDENPEKFNINYSNLLWIINVHSKLIHLEKQMYKGITLFNNGQITIGYNFLKKNLKKYYDLINEPLKKYTTQEYLLMEKPSNAIINNLLFSSHKDFIIQSILKGENTTLVDYSFPINNIHANDRSWDIMMDKIMIKASQSYKIYQEYFKILKKMDRLIKKNS